jgi:hypothetical protein
MRPSFVARDSVAALATSPKKTDPGVVGHGVAGCLAIGFRKKADAEATLMRESLLRASLGARVSAVRGAKGG